MTYTLRATTLLIPLVAALAMSPVAPEAGNALFLVAGILAVLQMRGPALGLLVRPIVWMPILALLLLTAAYGFGPRRFGGIVGVLYFAPIMAIWPLLSLARAGAVPNPLLIAVLGLCGVAGAAIVAVGEVLATGAFRAGMTVANPIHFADVAISIGFLTTVGVAFAQGAWRYVFLAGPMLGTIAVVLSGTRGAIIAVIAMVLVGAVAASALRLVSLRTLLLAGITLLIAGAVAFFLGASQLYGVQRVIADVGDVLRTGIPTDASTDQRLQMYLGGYRAFVQSPIFGHGLEDFAVVAGTLADVPFEGTPHLHSDIVDFAASSGALGLTAYFLLLLAPFFEAVRAPQSVTRAGTIAVISVLTAGYFVMGLTNAMFGILNVTTCFAAIAVVAGLLSNPQSGGSSINQSRLEA